MKGPPLDLYSLFSRFLRKIGYETALSLLLLLVAMSSVAYGLTLVVRGFSPVLSVWIAALGLLAGWLLALSSLPVWYSGMVASLIGLVLLIMHVGGLERALFDMLLRTNRLAQAFLYGPQSNPLFMENVRSTEHAAGQFIEKLVVLFERLAAYFHALLNGGPVFDPLATVVIWGAALWFASIWAAWGIRRYERPLFALLPGGVLVSACLSYTSARPFHPAALPGSFPAPDPFGYVPIPEAPVGRYKN
jgi:hypothetical protein